MGNIVSSLFILANILTFANSAKIKREKFTEDITEGFLGYKLVFHPLATLIEFVSLIFVVIAVRLVIDFDFYWNSFYALITVLINFALSLIVFYLFRNFSEDSNEKFQGYMCILHLAIIAVLGIVAV